MKAARFMPKVEPKTHEELVEAVDILLKTVTVLCARWDDQQEFNEETITRYEELLTAVERLAGVDRRPQ